MDEYVKRKAVIDLITRRYENPEICTQEINSIPAADVAPVVHGRWIHDGCRIEGGIDWCHCSECGKSDNFCARTNYCPKCGAKMDGGESDAAD